jgi:transposase
MASPQKVPLRALSDEEQRTLERIAQASSDRLDRVCRAKALLAVALGQPFAQAARQAGLRSPSAVAGIVGRFNQGGLASLRIAAGRGRKPTYDTTARTRIVSTAQRAPDRRTDGTATWSLSTLQRRLRQDGLPHLGATTIRRVLEDAGSSYQRTRTWCPTGTAQRKRKSGVVTVVDPQTEARSS